MTSEKEKDNPKDLKEKDHEIHQGSTGNLKSKKKQTREKELQENIEKLNDKYLRLYADFENYRKRVLKEKIEYSHVASADVIASLLPVLDDFDRALTLSETAESVDAIREGEIIIYNKLKSILEQKGLQEMVSNGQPFTTDFHEAITSIPAPSDDMKGKVIDQTEKGYLLNGKVLRFAKVIVGS